MQTRSAPDPKPEHDTGMQTDSQEAPLYIMSENDKGLLFSLGMNQFVDVTQDKFENTYFRCKPQNVSPLSATLGTVPLGR